MNAPVCVIGGNGFLGGHIVDALMAKNRPVRVFARRQDPFRAPLAGVTYVSGDFTEIGDLAPAIAGCEQVVHCLTTTMIQSSNADKVFDITSNLIGTVRLLDACVAAGVKRVVFVSSGGAIYGTPEIEPTPEHHPLRPTSSYGIVKAAIENYLRLYQVLHGLEYTSLRLSNPYGPRQNPASAQGVISIFAAKALRGDPISIFGDGSALRDYVHATDFADAVIKALETDQTNLIVNIGSGHGTSLNDILAMIEAATDKPLIVSRTGARSGEIDKSVLDISLAHQTLRWQPQVTLKDGIAEQVDWLRSIGVQGA